jgi:hypothetical protein
MLAEREGGRGVNRPEHFSALWRRVRDVHVVL